MSTATTIDMAKYNTSLYCHDPLRSKPGKLYFMLMERGLTAEEAERRVMEQEADHRTGWRAYPDYVAKDCIVNERGDIVLLTGI